MGEQHTSHTHRALDITHCPLSTNPSLRSLSFVPCPSVNPPHCLPRAPPTPDSPILCPLSPLAPGPSVTPLLAPCCLSLSHPIYAPLFPPPPRPESVHSFAPLAPDPLPAHPIISTHAVKVASASKNSPAATLKSLV